MTLPTILHIAESHSEIELVGLDCLVERLEQGDARAPQCIQPDVVVIDLASNEDSLRVCRTLRAQDPLDSSRILLVLSAGNATERLPGYEAGADDVLSRPVDSHELQAKLRVFAELKPQAQVEALKSGILAMVQHETRTPLTGVLSSAELLLGEHAMEDDERRQYVETIQECGERLANLLERVMKLSALKSGSWGLHVEPTCLATVLQEALRLVQPKAYQAEVRLQVRGEVELEVLVDGPELGESLFAVLDNAVQHAPPGSNVEIDVNRSEGDVTLSIRDHGVGLAADMHSVVFEEFTSGDVLHHGGGNGLSLAIARQVLRMMGGDVRVASEPGDGAIFTLRIPALLTAPAAPESTAPQGGAAPEASDP